MREEARRVRQEQIREAAYRLLEAHGYAGTSMLSIAKAAKASNETLYRWYGEKKNLFKSMVEDNAEALRELLETDFAIDRPPLATLSAFGPKLLAMLLGERAVALNRAAAGDVSGELGQAIAEGGRNTIVPLLEQTMSRAIESGDIDAVSAGEAVELYLSLLIGDLQIRRVIGVLPEPGDDEIAARSEAAMTSFLRLVALPAQRDNVARCG